MEDRSGKIIRSTALRDKEMKNRTEKKHGGQIEKFQYSQVEISKGESRETSK